MSNLDLFEHRLRATARGVHLFMLAEEVRVDPADRRGQGLSGNGNLRTLAGEMRELRDDLERLEDGWVPDEDDLAGAPRLENWGIAFRDGEPLWRILGDPYEAARDIPGVEDGQTLCTMQVLAVDDRFSWVRDRRGFYVLGEPHA